MINVDDLFGRAATRGALEFAKKEGLQVVFVDAYPLGNTDFSRILTKVRALTPTCWVAPCALMTRWPSSAR